MKQSLNDFLPPPSKPIVSKIRHRSEFYSGNLMLSTATLTIERVAYYSEGKNSEEAKEAAQRGAARGILSEVYSEISPLVSELLKELGEAQASKRRDRCLVLARSIAKAVRIEG